MFDFHAWIRQLLNFPVKLNRRWRRRQRPIRTFKPITDDLEPRNLFTINTTVLPLTFGEGIPNPVVTVTFTDTTPSPVSGYTATIDWGDGTATSGIVSVNSAGAFVVTGTHSYPEETSTPYTITTSITETGNDHDMAIATTTATVAETPVAVTPLVFSPTENGTFTATIASFVDPGGAEPNIYDSDSGPTINGYYTATIYWGDGTTDIATLSYSGTVGDDSNTNPFYVTDTHTYAEEGTYTVTISVNHEGFVTNATEVITVQEVPVVGSGNTFSGAAEGSPTGNVTVATFTDPAGAEAITEYTAVINWGDGVTSFGTLTTNGPIGSATTQFFVIGDHEFTDEGTFTVTVTVTHDLSSFGTVSTFAVADSIADSDVLNGTGNPVTATEGMSFSGTVADFTNTGYPANTGDDFNAVIYWGDGATSVGTVTNTPSPYEVTGTHTYAEEGSYTVSVVLTDDAPGTATATATSTATVADPSVLPSSVAVSATEGMNFSVTVATFTDPGGAEIAGTDYSAVIDWGDLSTSVGTITLTSGSVGSSSAVFTVTGAHTYVEEGSYTVSVTIDHDASTPSTVTEAANVADPSVIPSSVAVSGTEGASLGTVTVATFTDPGGAEIAGTDYSATIDWGDGATATAGTITLTSGSVGSPSAVFTVTGSHTYIEEGSYIISVTIDHDVSIPVTVTDSANVSDPSVIAAGPGVLNTTEGLAFTTTVATFTDPGGAEPNAGDPSGTAATHYSAVIDWGDGQTSAGSIVPTLAAAPTPFITTSLSAPQFMAFDSRGDLFIANPGNGTVSEVAVGTGTATTFVSGLGEPNGLAFDSAGDLFIADFTAGIVYEVPAGTSTPTPFVSGFNEPTDLAFDSSGDLFVASYADSKVYEIPFGTSTPVADITSGIGNPYALAFDSAGNLYISNDDGSGTVSVAAPGFSNANVFVSGLSNPSGLAFDSSGNLWIGDNSADTVYEVPAGTTVPVAVYSEPNVVGVQFDQGGNLYLSDNTDDEVDVVTLGFTVTGSHSYVEEGSFTVSVTINHEASTPQNLTFAANVADPSVIATTTPFTATEGVALTGQTVATFVDPGNGDLIQNGYFAGNGGVGTSSFTDWSLYNHGAGDFFVTDGNFVNGDPTPPDGVAAITAQPGPGTHVLYQDFTVPSSLNSADLQFELYIDSTGSGFVNGPLDETGGPVQEASIDILADGSAPNSTSAADDLLNIYHTEPGDPLQSGYTLINTDLTAFLQAHLGQTLILRFAEADNVGPLHVGIDGVSLTYTTASAEPVGDYSATIDWGDGTAATAGTIAFNSNGTYSVLGNHTYGEEGVYTVSVTINHESSTPTTVAFTVTAFENPVLASSVATFNLTEGQAFAGLTVATFTDPGGAEVVGDYSAVINWGDGQTSLGTISRSGPLGATTSVFSVLGNHTYTEEGSYTVTATIFHELAQNLIRNGGFEAGLTHWKQGRTVSSFTSTTVSVTTTSQATSSDPDGGDTAAEFTPPDLDFNLPNISQNITDIPGNTYQVSFWVNSNDSDSTFNEFRALWDGTVLTDQVDFSTAGPFNGYQEFTFDVTGTGQDTLTFAGRTDTGSILLDDVQVTTTDGPVIVSEQADVADPSVVATSGNALTVYNTGTSGVAYSVDPHYTLVASADPAFPGPNAIVVDPANSPINSSSWTPDTATASWIAPQGNQSVGNDPGLYDYQTTVTVPTGDDPDSVVLTGDVYADNSVEIFVNGVDTGVGFSNQFTSPGVFTLDSGNSTFHTGVNTIDFDVTNAGVSANPTGLLVDNFAGSAQLAATEGTAFGPSTVATFTDPGGNEPNSSDPGPIGNHYSAVINWGDGTTSAGTITQDYTPIAATGYNEDVVYEAGVGPAVSNSFDGGNGDWYQNGAVDTGNNVHNNGLDQSFVSNFGVPFSYQSFTGNNTLYMGRSDPASGTLTFTTPTAYEGLSILAASADDLGGGTPTFTINFVGGGTAGPFDFNAPDWTDNGSPYAALPSNVQIALNTINGVGGPMAGVQGGVDHQMFETDLNLEALGFGSTPIASITFTKAAAAGETGIFAISGTTTLAYNITGSHTYGEEGSYVVTTTINHEESVPTTVTSSVTVADPAVIASNPTTVTGLFNTGGTGVVGSVDPHWTLVNSADPSYPGPDAVVVDPNNSPIQSGGWFADTGTAFWIAPNADQTTIGDSPGNYDYQTTFAIPAEDTAASVVITGDAAADDSFEIFVNGVDTGIGASGNESGPALDFTLDSSNSHFVNGVNTIDIIVTNAGPVVNATGLFVDNLTATAALAFSEGATFGGTVATFTDPGGAEPNMYDPDPNIYDHYSAVINWGDGFTSAGTITYSGTPGSTTGVFTVDATHTFGEEGTYTVTVTINHEDSTPQVLTFTADVAEVPVVASSVATFNATEGQAFSNVTLATFIDPAGAEPNIYSIAGGDGTTIPDSYQALINWGDGSQSMGTIVYNGTPGSTTGVFSVVGNHTYGEEGSYTVTTTVFHEVAQNLINNGDFHAGLSGWTLGRISRTFTTTFTSAHSTTQPVSHDPDGSGTAAAFIPPTFTLNLQTLSQNFATTPGQQYLVTFWVDSSADPGDNEILVQWDGQDVFHQTDFATTGIYGNYQEFSVLVTGSGFDSLSIGGRIGAGILKLDDVAVVANVDGVTAGTDVNVADPSVVPTGGFNVAATEGLAFNNATVATFTDPGGFEPNQYDNPIGANLVINPGFETDFDASPPFGWTAVPVFSGAFSQEFDPHTGSNSAGFTGGEGLSQVVSTVPGQQYVFSFWINSDGNLGNEFQASFNGATVLDTHEAPADGYQQYVYLVTATSGSTLIEFNSVSGAFDLDDVGVWVNNPSDHYTADIGWGDGLFSPGVISVNPNTGVFTVVGTHTYADEGTYTVSVTLHHESAVDVSVTDTATVADNDTFTGVSNPVTGTEGTAFAGTVAVFTDTTYPDNPGSDFNVVINWGDGTTSAGAITGIGSGQFAVTAAHTYTDEGTFLVTTTISDDSPGTATGTVTVAATIADGDVLAAGASVSIAASEGAVFSGTVANFINTGTYDGPAGDFVATINWGDGATSAGTIVGTGVGTYSVTGTHTFAEEGSYTVSVTMSEDDLGTNPESTATASTTNTATIAEVPVVLTGVNISGSEGGVFTGTVATFVDPAGPEDRALNYLAVINWGDGATSVGTITVSGTTFSVVGTHTYAEEGSYAVSTSVLHGPNLVANGGFELGSVSNDPPVDWSGGGGAIFTNNQSYTGSQNVAMGTVGALGFISQNLATTPGQGYVLSLWLASDGGTPNEVQISWNGGVIYDQLDLPAFGYTDLVFFVAATSNSTALQIGVQDNPGFMQIDDVTVMATGAPSTTASAASTAAIAEVPVVGAGVAVAGTEGGAIAGATVATFTDPAGAEALGNYTATIYWGDGATETGVISFSGSLGSSAAVFSVTGSHAYSEEGSYAVTIEINHEGTITDITATASIAEVPVVGTGVNVSGVSEGTPFSGAEVATFTDPAGAENVTEYPTTIDWGDGQTSVGFVSGVGAGFAVTGSHTYAEEGTYLITTTIDHGGDITAVTSVATVADLPVSATAQPVTGSEGVSFTEPTATFTDPGGPENPSTDYSATISWGDGQTEAGVITLSGAVFTVTGTHAYAEEGDYTVSTTVYHDSTTPQVVASVAVIAEQPVVGAGSSFNATEGLLLSGQSVATFTDPGGPEVTGNYLATIDWGDGTGITTGTVTLSGSTFTVSGTHTYVEEGAYVTTVVINHLGDFTTVTGSATVADPALIGGSVTIFASEGTLFTGEPVATFVDPGGTESASDYSAIIQWGDGSTSAGTFDINDGYVLGNHTYAEEGTYTVTVTMFHEAAPSTTVVSTADVAEVPVQGVGIDVNATEGGTFAADQVAAFADPAGAETSPSINDFYTATINWGDGTSSEIGTLNYIATTQTFIVLGGHTYSEEGTYQITTTINHEGDLTIVTSTASVAEVPVVGTGVNVTGATENGAFAGATVATFSDPAGPEGLSSYSATIYWGDGATSAGTIAVSAGAFAVTGGHTYVEEGTYLITTVINHEGDITTVTSTASVAEVPVVGSGVNVTGVTEGFAFNGAVVANFSDPAGPESTADYTAVISWGDGATSVGIVTAVGPNFEVTGGHTYAEEGTFNITTSIDHEGDITVVSSTATVGDASVVATAVPVNASEGIVFTLPVATFTDPGGPENAATDYSAVIAWGDGQTSAGTISLSGTTFTVTGTHAYAEEGPYNVSTTIDHDASVPTTVVGSAAVVETPVVGAAVAIAATEGTTLTSTPIATFTDPGGNEPVGDYLATVDWGDGGGVQLATVSVSGGTYTVSGTHTYTEEGTYVATVMINHEGDITTVTSLATVTDPAVVATGIAVSGSENAAFANQATASFTDPGGPEFVGDYSATINWGDGSTSAGTIAASGTTFTGVTYYVLGGHTYAQEGTYQVTTTIDHETSTPQVVTSVATIAEVPVVGTGVAVAATEAGAFAGATVATFTDPAGAESLGNYTATINWGDGATETGAITLSGATFTVTGNHAYAEEGTYLVTTTVDHDGANTVVTSVATVAEVPVVGSGVNVTGPTENAAFAGATVATFTDPAGAEAVGNYTATIYWGDGATSAGSITLSAGTFSVTGGHTYAQEGTYLVTTTINHEGDLTAVTSIATVAEVPVVGAGVNVSGTEGMSFGLVPVATFSDPAGAEATSEYSAVIAWGDGTTSLGAITSLGGAFAVVGSHIYAEEGTLTITTTINHGGDATVVTSTAAIGDASVKATAVPVAASEGIAVTVPVATFTDPGGPENPSTDYSATINWGDGQTSAGAINLAGSTFTVAGTHTYAAQGPYNISTTINHDVSTPTTVVGSAAVTEVPVVASPVSFGATEGLLFSGQTIATFPEPEQISEPASHFTASVNWGDGTGLQPATISSSAGVFTVSGNHTYAEEGTYVTTVYINHEGTVTSVTGQATVTDPPVSATGAAVNGSEGASLVGAATATFTDPGGPEAVGEYSAVINWGDGGTSLGAISASGNQFTGVTYSVIGTHTYSQEGTYLVTTTIDHLTSAPQTVTSVATIAEVPVAGTGANVTGSEGAAIAGATVATFTDPAGAESLANYTATINWGDGHTSLGTISFSGSLGSSTAVFTVTGGHTYAEEGTYAITTTVNHDGDLTAVTSSANIADPSVIGTAVPVTVTATASFTATVATFTDPGGAEAVSDYSATISWGDGATSAGTIALSGSTFSVTGSHTYAVTGTYTVATVLNHDVSTPQLVAGVATVTGGLPFSDNFNTGKTLSANWTTQTGTFFLNNYAIGALTPITNLATVNQSTSTDVVVQADVNFTQLQTYAGLVARFSGSGNSGSFYLGQISVVPNPSNPTQPIYQAAIYRFVNGTSTVLVNNNLTVSGNGLLTFDVVGPSLKLYLNGQLVAYAQDTMLTSGLVGMRISTVELDDFSANAFVQPTTTLPFGPVAFTANPPGNQLGSNWIEEAGNFNTSTGAAVGQANTNLAVLTNLNTANQAVQATAAFTANGQSIGLVARYNGPLDSNEYIGQVTRNSGTSYTAAIYLRLNGASTLLASSTIANGNGTVQFDVVGNSLKLFVNNTLAASAFDSNLTMGSAGMRTTGAGSINDFSVSAITPVTPTLPFSDTFAANPPQNQLSLNWMGRSGNFSVGNPGAVGGGGTNDAVLNGVSVTNATVTGNATFTSGGANFGLLARATGTGDANAYLANLHYAGGNSYTVNLYKNTGSSWVQIGSTISQSSSSKTHSLQFVLSGSSLTISLDGTPVITTTDSSITGAGSVGMRTTTATVTVNSFGATSP